MRALAFTVALVCAGAVRAESPGGWRAVDGRLALDRAVVRPAESSSLRLEPADGSDAVVESAPVTLAIGHRYELAAWVRTDGLAVEQLDRAPVAVGAAVMMASMPFDVHSRSVGGTRDWTRVRLRFTATRAEDQIVLVAGAGGEVRGRAWFAGVQLEPIAANDAPVADAVETFGPAYRYPQGAWIHLHIEGRPYERGYQHGWLMAREIPDYVNRCALLLDSKSSGRAWDQARTTVNALFLRGFDREILEEMKGIADGARDGGAKWHGRAIDLLDIVAANTSVELGTLDSAVPATPTGLEGLKLTVPPYASRPAEHCSAFAVTGKATRDGRMVIGHITMWPLLLGEVSNVMLDLQPAAGHRILMQSYPGGIESGLDWYQNDAGVVLTETTIKQSPFNVRGTPVAYRARKAIQYGGNVDEVVEYLSRGNNGLYTNEWLIGDAKNNEIAMLELGTNRTRLWRSSRNEWFGGTEGFYWGCNNGKDLEVRLEDWSDPASEQAYIPFVPAPRDLKWQELYRAWRGRIDERFGFTAFRTAPLVSSSSMDAKVTTAEMAKRMMVWGVFGKPNEREWVPSSWEREAGATGLYSGGYRLVQTLATAPAGKPVGEPPKPVEKRNPYKDRLWKGWILPASGADTWLAAGTAEYRRALAGEDWQEALGSVRAGYTAARQRLDQPLRALTVTPSSRDWYSLAETKGALLLDALRREIGDDRFFELMRGVFAAHTGQRIDAASFVSAAEKVAGKPLGPFFARWLEETNIETPAVYAAGMFGGRLATALIVYGTDREAGANRFAAEQVRRTFLNWYESRVPVRKDFEVSPDELKSHDVLFIGRPETNSALEAWRERLGLDYEGSVFRVAGGVHARATEALVTAAANPLDPARLVVVIAGNSPLETVRVSGQMPFGDGEYAVWREGKRVESGYVH